MTASPRLPTAPIMNKQDLEDTFGIGCRSRTRLYLNLHLDQGLLMFIPNKHSVSVNTKNANIISSQCLITILDELPRYNKQYHDSDPYIDPQHCYL